MKLTCLSKGNGVHYPPCHMLELCGFRLLLECPIDLSAIDVFEPITAVGKIDPLGFICAEPWYKTAKYLHLWNVSLIDAVLISTPAGILGLPFLTRNPSFSAKIYATEATMKIGRLMMDDLVSMHAEYVQVYGRRNAAFPEWMGWEELEKLPLKLREAAIGEDAEEFCCWLPLYSAAEIDACMEKIQALKYAEEVCYNGTIVLKAFSSGLEIGSCNWKINAPRRNFVYISNSIFESSQALGFDYGSLQGADLILFSDMSSVNDIEEEFGHIGCSTSNVDNDDKDWISVNSSPSGTIMAEEDEITKLLMDNSEILEENDKLNFITCSIADSIKEGGSVLIPIGRFGVVLQLLEQISDLLVSLSLEVPIFMISTTAEQALAFTNAIPEWLCKKRQQKLFCGEPLFSHVELAKARKLLVFPLLYSSDLPLAWREPCIVFTPHWTLRLGPAVHLLNRWHKDRRCLLILEEGIDTEMALSPFKPMTIRVLQCSFLSGIPSHKIYPLLVMLKPKLVLVHEDLRHICISRDGKNSFPFLFYSMDSTLRVPNLKDDFGGRLMTNLAAQLQPRRLTSKEMAIARLRAKLVRNQGRVLLVCPKKPSLANSRLLLWGSVDAIQLLAALKAKGLNCSIAKNDEVTVPDDNSRSVRILVSEEAVIETSATRTVICTTDAALAKLIYEILLTVCDGI